MCLAMKEGEDRRHRSTFWVETGWQHLVSEVGMSEKQEGDDTEQEALGECRGRG